MNKSIVEIRPVAEADAEGLSEANKSLNSPHAPTDPSAVKKIIAASQNSISGRGTPTQVNVVAEEIRENGERQIVGGGAVVKMGSDGEDPILWMPNSDGSLTRHRYTAPTLEFGGVSVAKEAQGRGIGKGISMARALIARAYGPLFDANTVLSDFNPPFDNQDTKENAFWNEMILPLLRENGNLAKVMAYCEEKTGIPIENTAVLSAVIGNVMSDADRNAMVDKFFPQTIPADRITPNARTVMQNVNGPTEAARANLVKIYGPEFKIMGTFPINGGPNYAAPTRLGPVGEGPTPLQVQEDLVERVKILIFKPLGEGFEGLRNFRATIGDGAMTSSGPAIDTKIAQMANFTEGDQVMSLRL